MNEGQCTTDREVDLGDYLAVARVDFELVSRQTGSLPQTTDADIQLRILSTRISNLYLARLYFHAIKRHYLWS